MTLLAKLALWSMFAFGGLLFVIQLAAHELGSWIGRRAAVPREERKAGTGVLAASLLGLLAFVLALTLSFANDRFTERRAGTLSEANAIGTAWLRAKALGLPQSDEIAKLLEEYAVQRLAFVKAPYDPAMLDEIDMRTQALEAVIWEQMSAIVRERPSVVVNSLMTALNEVFDMTTAERFAFELRLPPQIFWLLMGLTLLGMGVLGYEVALTGVAMRMLAAMLALTWTVVVVDIIDLSAARLGGFRTSPAAYEWTIQSFHAEPSAPHPQ